jgi:hypothetical protein
MCSYYDSIDHYPLLMQLHEHIGDRTLIGYLWQFLNRCVEWGGILLPLGLRHIAKRV